MATIISICTLRPSIGTQNQIRFLCLFLALIQYICLPFLPQYHSYKNNDKFIYCLENHWMMSVIISIATLIPLHLSNRFFLSVATFPRWAGKPVNLNIRQYQSERNSEKFSCCLEIQSKIAAIISLHPKLFKVRFPLWL